MQEITRYIYDFSKCGCLANETFIRKNIEYFLEYYQLNNFVAKIFIGDYNQDFLARYFCESKKLYINYRRLLYSVVSYISNFSSLYDYNEIMLMTNLYISYILIHELKHIIQDKKMQLEGSEEAELLVVSQEWEYQLKLKTLYNNVLYRQNPIERQADIFSLKKIIEICNLINNKKIYKFYSKKLLERSFEDYERKSNAYPTQSYFKNFLDQNRIFKIKESLRTAMGVFERVEFGLPLNDLEFQKLEKKLILSKNKS